MEMEFEELIAKELRKQLELFKLQKTTIDQGAKKIKNLIQKVIKKEGKIQTNQAKKGKQRKEEKKQRINTEFAVVEDDLYKCRICGTKIGRYDDVLKHHTVFHNRIPNKRKKD